MCANRETSRLGQLSPGHIDFLCRILPNTCRRHTAIEPDRDIYNQRCEERGTTSPSLFVYSSSQRSLLNDSIVATASRIRCSPACFLTVLIHNGMMSCYVTIMAWVCDASYKQMSKSLRETVEGKWDLGLKEDAKR